MAYGTTAGVEGRLPAMGQLGPLSLPTEAQVTAWLTQGAAIINRTLSGAGYSTPVGVAASVYAELTALNELYAAAWAIRARGLDTVQGENEDRSAVWLQEFQTQLTALVGFDLTRLGVEVLPSAAPNLARRRLRFTPIKRVDGYSAVYDDVEVDA